MLKEPFLDQPDFFFFLTTTNLIKSMLVLVNYMLTELSGTCFCSNMK